MTVSIQTRRPSIASRRVGYAIAAAVNAVLLYLINVRPGWEVVPFLTGDMGAVLPLLNASLVVGIVANGTFLAYDAPWWKALGDLTTTCVGLVVLVRLWTVFPFAFTGGFDWALVVRVLLVVAVAGTAIAVVVHTGSLVRTIAARCAGSGREGSR
jgi:hypothetical protein